MPKNTNYFWAQCRCPQYSGNCRRIGRERGWKWNTILLLRLPHSTLDFNQVFYFSSIRVFESKKEAWINSVDSKKIFILIARNRNDEFNAKFTYYIYILRWAFHHSQKKCFLCGNCRCDDVRLFIVSCDCGIRWMNSVNFFVFVFNLVSVLPSRVRFLCVQTENSTLVNIFISKMEFSIWLSTDAWLCRIVATCTVHFLPFAILFGKFNLLEDEKLYLVYLCASFVISFVRSVLKSGPKKDKEKKMVKVWPSSFHFTHW